MTEVATVELPDGRSLAYETYGRADGRPVVCCHGNPGSRLLWSLLDEVAQERDVRLIAPDRPGFGRSDFLPGRRLTDWPEDVAALADDLDLDRFGVVGFSAGGPHAAACAHALPDGVASAVLVGSVAPPSIHEYAEAYERGLYAVSRSIPGASRGLFGAAGWLARNWRSRFREAMRSGLSERDRDLLAGPAGDVLVADAAEAFRGGGRGPAHEFPMLGDAWGFDPTATTPPVALYHGEADRLVDAGMSRSFAHAVPDADLHLVEGGHYSTLVDHAAAILDDAVP